MKANELMIGDWVKPQNVDSYFKVGLIGADSIWNDTDTAEWDLDELEPIPLTPEILERNGFIVKHPESVKRTYWKDRAGQIVGHKNRGLMYMEISGNPVKFGYFLPHFSGHIQYVHQFQHCLKMVGIDEHIEL